MENLLKIPHLPRAVQLFYFSNGKIKISKNSKKRLSVSKKYLRSPKLFIDLLHAVLSRMFYSRFTRDGVCSVRVCLWRSPRAPQNQIEIFYIHRNKKQTNWQKKPTWEFVVQWVFSSRKSSSSLLGSWMRMCVYVRTLQESIRAVLLSALKGFISFQARCSPPPFPSLRSKENDAPRVH